jgi:hypothetical protein
MRALSVPRKPFALVVSGLSLGTAGLVVLSVATFQTQKTMPATPLSGPITLTFTSQPMNPAYAVFLVWVMAIPLVLFFVPWKFYLTTLVLPTFAALNTVVLIVDSQLVTGLVVSSATWVFVGDALIFVGCFVESIGIVTERTRRTKRLASPSSQDRPTQSAVSPPR